MQTLVSLHDVTPAHRERLDRAEVLLHAAGVTRVAYLLVPEFHRAHVAARDAAFIEWCRRPRPYTVDWVLHGYYHLDDRRDTVSGAGLRIARRAMTANEGEFAGLSAREQHDRLLRGIDVFESIVGTRPQAFVPPAWLFNDELVGILADLHFHFTEDHWRVIDVRGRTSRRCPAITWATRTPVRRIGSRVLCPLLHRVWRSAGPVRIAMHPFDMDHPLTSAQIKVMLQGAVAGGSIAGYEELLSQSRQ